MEEGHHNSGKEEAHVSIWQTVQSESSARNFHKRRFSVGLSPLVINDMKLLNIIS